MASVPASGACLIRVEVQCCGLLFTVITDRHGDTRGVITRRFTDREAAIAEVREFLGGFGVTEPCHGS
jgi:hypothetical protein